MNTNFTISCPCCSEKIDVEKLLKDQRIKDLSSKLNSETNRFIESEVNQRLDKKIRDNRDIVISLESQLNEQEEKIKRLNKFQIENKKLERNLKLQEDDIKEKIELGILEALEKEEERLVEKAKLMSEVKLREKDKKLGDQKRLIDEMQRKIEQGSMQTQGEIGEIMIEDWLKETFTQDKVEEIKKGENGADCILHIGQDGFKDYGSIIIESKRTKSFQNSWIEKLKNDMRDKKADTAILVTKTMPSSSKEKITIKNGVIICSFEEFKIIAPILRESIIQYKFLVNSQKNKGDKMTQLYDYLTGTEFKLHVEGIIEGVVQMQDDLHREQNLMKKLWKQRENQIKKVVNNSVELSGSFKGIIGKEVKEVELLELKKYDE